MTTEVTDDDFQEILAQTRHFVRTAVVPREQEILADDRVPDELREQARKMGLFGYAIPQEWAAPGRNLLQASRWPRGWGTPPLPRASCSARTKGMPDRFSAGLGPANPKTRR